MMSRTTMETAAAAATATIKAARASTYNVLSVRWLLFLVVFLSQGLVSATETSSAGRDGDSQCGLYLAPSSTSSQTQETWGLYAGQDFNAGEIVGNNELAVNVLHLKANMAFDEESEDVTQRFFNDLSAFLESFMWVPSPAGARFEMVEGKTITYIPGAGILSAMNDKLTNTQWDHSSAYSRPMLGEIPGESHPGRGAQTPFYNVAIKATNEIPTGSEIFLNYGANYVEESEELQREDYEKLDATIEKIIDFFAKYDGELDENAMSQIYGFLTADVMTAAVGTERQSIIEKILPSDPRKLHEILEAGGSMKYDKQSAFRNKDWMEQNGFCADNIKCGESTIKGAGRGAFATRTIEQGAVITASPMIHLPSGRVMDMYSLESDGEGDFVRESDEAVLQQLLLNYCFSHKESSMLFLPAGPGVTFINHSKKPNAKLQWSDHPYHHGEWFDVAPQHLLASQEFARMGLVMEVVALEKIEEGDEIFISYGEEWEEAWKDHSEQWNDMYSGADPWPTKAIEMNEKYRQTPLPTEDEGATLPENIGLMAFIMIKESTAPGTLEDPKFWDMPEVGTAFDAENLFEVSIVERQELQDDYQGTIPYNYTIRWLNVKQEPTYVGKVPHRAIVFVDYPEQSDHFVETAFRHPIGLPDDVFPQGPWRNFHELEDLVGDENEAEE